MDEELEENNEFQHEKQVGISDEEDIEQEENQLKKRRAEEEDDEGIRARRDEQGEQEQTLLDNDRFLVYAHDIDPFWIQKQLNVYYDSPEEA